LVNDLAYLAKRMGQIADGINKAVDKTTKDAADQALFNVVMDTPVDVGTARSNWAVGIGGAFVGTARRAFAPFKSRWKPRPGVNPGGSKGERSNAFAAINLGKSKIRTRLPEQDIYITNHLPYIAPLNSGHSKQSSPGFVGRAVIRAAKTTANRAEYHLKRELR
jgi:hypothetical protein